MNRSGPYGCANAADGGSALVVVLWVVMILSVLMSAFQFDAFVESKITSYYRKRTKAEHLAKSGLEVAELLMHKSREINKTTEPDPEDRWFATAKNLANGAAIQDVTEELGEGTITLEIIPEPARRNVNMLQTEEAWEQILKVGDITEETRLWPQLIEPFLDWMDKDDQVRTDGAETDDYYATLTPPYKAKNGPLDTVEELLLIKGFSRVILNGGTLKIPDQDEEGIPISGIGDLLTTYGDGKVNVNAASQRVLMTIPGMDDLTAELIMAERQGSTNETGTLTPTPFENINDFFQRIPDLDKTAIQQYITTSSAIYRITSVGNVQGVKSTIWCIATFDGKNMTILRWREED